MKTLLWILFPVLTVALLFLKIHEPPLSQELFGTESHIAKVISVEQEGSTQILLLELKKGPRKGERLEVKNELDGYTDAVAYEKGDLVVFLGGETGVVADHARGSVLLLLFLLFVGVVLLVNRKKGFLALLSMGFSFLVIFQLVLPLLLEGFDPVLASLLGAVLMLPVSFYVSHGFDKKTTVALLGTFLTLVVTGVLAAIFAQMGHLTGLGTEESTFLVAGGSEVRLQGLILAGIILGLQGVLDDVSMTQASIVQELKAAQSKIKFHELFRRSMAVGRDHIASVVNTLVLVYVGASLPLMLLFMDASQSFSEVVNYEVVAVEIIRTLVGSIGLVLAVPITTFIACHKTMD